MTTPYPYYADNANYNTLRGPINYTLLSDCLSSATPGFHDGLELLTVSECSDLLHVNTFYCDPCMVHQEATPENMIQHHNMLLHVYYGLSWTMPNTAPISLDAVSATERFKADVACGFRVPDYQELIWLFHRCQDGPFIKSGQFFRVLAAFRLAHHTFAQTGVVQPLVASKQRLVFQLVIDTIGPGGLEW